MGKSVLFIDDDETWRAQASAALTAAGRAVITAKNSAEAMPHVEGVGVGLIVLDTRLGEEDSLLLMRFLRHNLPGVPVLLFAEPDEDQAVIDKLIKEGADQYIPKGSMEELIVAMGYYFRD